MSDNQETSKTNNRNAGSGSIGAIPFGDEFDRALSRAEQIPKFQTNCDQMLAEVLRGTSIFATGRRNAIKDLRETLSKTADIQTATMRETQSQLASISQMPLSAWRQNLDTITKATREMSDQRSNFAAQVQALNDKTKSAKRLIQSR
jgi:hypothetical protein